MATNIGVDIGGTKIAVALVQNGRILDERRIPTTGFDESIERLIEAILLLRRLDTVGIGVGCTGPLDSTREVVMNGDTVTEWKGRNLVQPLRFATSLPVVMENDADAALVGEVFYGAGRRDQVTAMLTFGTGVGGAVWTGNGVYRGAFGEHPELGHMPALTGGPPCYCGISGCLEIVAAGPAIQAAAKDKGYADGDEYIRGGGISPVREAIRNAVWTVAHTFRPALVIMGGGIMEAHFGRLVPYESITPKEAPMLLEPMVIVPASLGNRAGVIGAACLVDL